MCHPVIPAQAGIFDPGEIPAFAGMTTVHITGSCDTYHITQ